MCCTTVTLHLSLIRCVVVSLSVSFFFIWGSYIVHNTYRFIWICVHFIHFNFILRLNVMLYYVIFISSACHTFHSSETWIFRSIFHLMHFNSFTVHITIAVNIHLPEMPWPTKKNVYLFLWTEWKRCKNKGLWWSERHIWERKRNNVVLNER